MRGMSTRTTDRLLKVRSASYDRLRDRIAIHDDSDGLTRPSRQLLAQAGHSSGLLARDIVNIVANAGTATTHDLEDLTGITLDDILDDLVANGTLTAADNTYRIAT